MNLFVTGATGCLGRRLALRLHGLGHQVTAQGRNRVIGAELEKAGLRFIAADLEDAPAMHSACRNRDAVFHCAAFSAPWGPRRQFYNSNVIGTQNVTDSCLQLGVSLLVHVSTPGLYFDFRNRRDIRETDPLPAAPVNAYAATKKQAEALVDKAFKQGLATITLRPRAIFGPHDRALMPRIMRFAERGWVPLIQGGKALIDVTYLDNVVDALVLCLDAPNHAMGRKYNITNGEPMPVGELFRLVFQAMARDYHPRQLPYAPAYAAAALLELWSALPFAGEPVLTRYTLGLISKDQTLNIDAARQDLGYTPRVSIRDGIAAYVAWWRSQHEHSA